MYIDQMISWFGWLQWKAPCAEGQRCHDVYSQRSLLQEHFDELRKALNMNGPTDTGITSLVKPAPIRLPQPDEQQVDMQF